MRQNNFNLILIFLGGVVLLFIAAPLLNLFLKSSLPELVKTAADSQVRESIGLTLWISMAGTLLFSVFVIPYAYFLARTDFPLKKLLMGITDIPIVIPHSAAGIALLGILSRDTLLGNLAQKFGFSFISHPSGIMIAMAFVSIPYLINSARDGFINVPENYEKAAKTLGAGPVRVFFSISLPLAWRSILTGLIMMWARGLSEFGAVIVIAYHPSVTPVLIYDRFTAFGLKYSRPVAALFILICLSIFILLRLLSNFKNVKTR